MDLLVTLLLIAFLFALLGSGLWIGLSLLGVAWIGMELFTSRPAGDAMAVTIWGSLSSWTLTALPLFVWMGEILFRTRLSEDMFKGLAPWLSRLPGRLLHTNIIGCTIFAAVSGSSAATCATIGKMTLPELQKRGYPEAMTIGTATEAAALGVVGALVISAVQGTLTAKVFGQSLMGATRLYCMIALILAGAAFLTLSMGYIGLPRRLAEFIGGLGLSQLGLLFWLMVFYIVLGCFLDGISMVVLTMGVILPTIQKAGVDLVWFGVFIVLVVEMAQITPPVGFNLFVIQGMTKRQITWIARAAFPLFLLMVVAVGLLYYFPGLV